MEQVQVAGTCAIVGAVLGLVLTPFVTAASAASYLTSVEPDPERAHRIRESFGPVLQFSDADTVYYTYGKVWVLVLGLILIGFRAFARTLEAEFRARSTWPLRMMLVGLIGGIVGNIGDYWLASFGMVVRGVGFGVTMLSWLTYATGSIGLAIIVVRSRAVGKWWALPFLLAPVGLVLQPVVPNAPANMYLPILVAWLALGILMVTRTKPIFAPHPRE